MRWGAAASASAPALDCRKLRQLRAAGGGRAGGLVPYVNMLDETDHTPLDVAIARLATRQHGVVSLTQLCRLGLEDSTVRMRIAAGRLHRIHRGVYAVGHRVLSTEGHWMAAVLACGEGAVLSYQDAAELWAMRRRSGRTYIDVTAPRRGGRRRPRIRVHSGATLHPADVTTHRGIPCTSPARTLLDLAEVLDRNALQRAVERAEALRIFDLVAIDELLARSNGRRGAPALRAAIARYRDTVTRSDIEDALLAICANANLARPGVNVWRPELNIEVDFMWPDRRLIVEADGHETHGTRAAIERDHRRDRRLRALGWRVERFTWHEITHEPDAVAAALSQLLAAAA